MLGPSLHEEKNTCRPGPTRTSVSKMTPVIKGFSTSRPILASPQADPRRGRLYPSSPAISWASLVTGRNGDVES